MDGVFMYKLMKRLLVCVILTAICWTVVLVRDRRLLNENLIRFHVVANSDTDADQRIKLQVRDAVLNSIQKDLTAIRDIDSAKQYLTENLPKIQTIANTTLNDLGIDQKAVVSFCRESFEVRHYDTFSLPAGVYDSLRIVIGEGNGRNWWCVAFPALCLSATSREFESVAVDSGLSESLTSTISDRNHHQIRFFLLEQLGSLQNIAFADK